MEKKKVQIEVSWYEALKEEFALQYFEQLRSYIHDEKTKGKTIYPANKNIFKAFELTKFDKVKAVILGQDPYHNPGEAMGLSFSVPKNVRIPPSLKNIYKEIERDLGHPLPTHGDLTKWANQGVLLLNAMLTVEHKRAGSHSKIGWQSFTDAVIKTLSDKRSNLVFLLWGNFAKSKRKLIDANKHKILMAAHPSPLARNAFNNCKHFSKTNEFLRNIGEKEIDWYID